MANERDAADVLGALALFSDLSRPQLEAAAHIFDEERFNRGQRILREGLTGSGFYVILDGQASINTGDKTVATLGRGDFFGEISILLGSPPTADVVAENDLRCLVLPGPQMKGFLEGHPKVMFRMLQAEAGRLRGALQWQD